ncbi:MAG: type II toxin-antitoxin system RelE/ParE family toxin [Spirochaetia bacterium]|nr:type II toxin-antitoxin system RelE/ParE family toxin [Spirochaetia bacterium]
MSQDFEIAETESFSKKIKIRDFESLKRKIENFVYPQLRTNPFYGSNIKKLKGQLKNIYRYRIGNFRLFYTIDSNKNIVIIIDIEKRKNSY